MDSLNPFHNRPAEWDLYSPIFGKTMLELGNKKNGDRTYKRYFESLGFAHTSIDWNGQDGALKMDLMRPLDLGTFDVVSNIGTTEHVVKQEPCWRNVCEAMHVGAVLISTTPKPGHWSWHGENYPTDEFYRQLALLNGLEISRLYESGETPRKMWFCRATRVKDVPFCMPDEKLIFRNRR